MGIRVLEMEDRSGASMSGAALLLLGSMVLLLMTRKRWTGDHCGPFCQSIFVTQVQWAYLQVAF